MQITVWQYNQVIDGLRMQLELQRRLCIEKSAEIDRLQKMYSDQAGELFTLKDKMIGLTTENTALKTQVESKKKKK